MTSSDLDAELGYGQSHDATDYQNEEYVELSQGTENKDSHLRSLVKGVTYRTVSTLATICITYFVLGDVSVAFEIGFVDFFAKLLIYYLHERAWSFVTFL